MGQVVTASKIPLRVGYSVERAVNEVYKYSQHQIKFVCEGCKRETIVPRDKEWYIVVYIGNMKDGRQFMARTATCSELCADFTIMADQAEGKMR